MVKKGMAVLIFLLVLGLMAGCGEKATMGIEETKAETTFVDSTGRTVKVGIPLERLVVVNSDAAEVLYALGAQDKIVGVSDTTEFPMLRDKEKVGQWNAPNLEKIAALKPDLVISYGNFIKEELVKKLEEAGIPVASIDCYNNNTLYQDVRILGELVGRQEKAEEYIAFVEKQLATVKERIKDLKEEQKPLVYMESYSDFSSVSSLAAGHELVSLAGGINIAAAEPVAYPKVSSEWILARNPQVVVKAVSGKVPMGWDAVDAQPLEQARQTLLGRAGWDNLEAVKQGQVYLLSGDIYVGPQSVIGICYMAKWFHPDLFQDLDPVAVHRELYQRFYGMDLQGIWVYPEG